MPIYLKGQYRLLKQVEKLGEETMLEVEEANKRTAQAIAVEAIRRLPSGSRASAIEIRVIGRGMTVAVDALFDYALAVEFGYLGALGRGNRGHSFPLKKIGGKWQLAPDLAAWAAGKSIPPWLLANKIYTEGYDAQPFLKPALDTYTDEYLAAVTTAVERAMAKVESSAGSPVAA